MNTKLINIIVTTFNANADMHHALDRELPKMTASQRKQFVLDTANALAKAASARWGEEIQTYDGQRGIAFGVWDTENGKMVRTSACDTTRKWFQRNITSKFDQPEPKQAPSAVWGKIVEELSEARKVAKRLPANKQKEFNRALADLIAEFSE